MMSVFALVGVRRAANTRHRAAAGDASYEACSSGPLRRGRAVAPKRFFVAVVVLALVTSCSSSKPNPSAADVRAYTAWTCGAVRGLRSVEQSIQKFQPQLTSDKGSRAALKARYVELLGTAASAATAGEQYFERAPLPKGHDATAHAQGVKAALNQLSADFRTWQKDVSGFDIDDRDNWEDEVNTLDGGAVGTAEHNWNRVLSAVGAGDVGHSVNDAAGHVDECRSVLVPLSDS